MWAAAGAKCSPRGPRRGERVIAPQGLVVRRLDEDYAADLTSSFDNLYVYLPITEWRAFTADHAGGRQARLKCPDGLADPSIGALAQALAPALRQPSAADLLFIEYLLVAMLTQLLQAHGELTAPTARGGLAFWQRRRAEDMLRAALAHDISVAELAAECRLSSGYFIRAFKQSFGVTPHQWLSRARVETAMTLLVEQRMSLAEVAQSCGFSDQSHMSRVFRQHLGHPPARWRQLREA
jgi:AraC family transcriptional regulator